MQLRRRRTSTQNAIIIFPLELSLPSYYLPIQVDKVGAEFFIRNRYPDAKITFLPDSFTPVITALCNKSIGCSRCHDAILHHIATRFSGDLNPPLLTEEDVNYYCISVIIHQYIFHALNEFNDEEEVVRFRQEVYAAKEKWIMKRLQRLQCECYLGLKDFDSDLRRSCAEFYMELKKACGFSPLKMFYMK